MLNADQSLGHRRFSSQILASQSLRRSRELAAVGSEGPVSGARRDNFRDNFPSTVSRGCSALASRKIPMALARARTWSRSVEAGTDRESGRSPPSGSVSVNCPRLDIVPRSTGAGRCGQAVRLWSSRTGCTNRAVVVTGVFIGPTESLVEGHRHQ